MMYIFHDESNFSWLAVPLRLAKECLLALLYQKRKMPRFLARAAGYRVLTGRREASKDPTPARFPKGRCPERISPRGRIQSRRPGCREWGTSLLLAEPLCSSTVRRNGGRRQHPGLLRPLPAPRAPRAPGMRRGRGCVGAGAAAGILHPSRFCLPRANSRGLKVFHLERQSAFFLSIPGQTPMVPGTSLLPNGGAAFSFRLRVILLALLCWNRA